MKFALNKDVSIIVFGAGGTGGHIAPNLYRLLYASDRCVKIVIADGDIAEEKNLVRQNFIAADLGRNKAQVLAERYAAAFGMEAHYVPEFIESEAKLAELIKPAVKTSYDYRHHTEGLVILIGAVDNNKSRQLCHKVFKNACNLIYIDSGNGGQVVCAVSGAIIRRIISRSENCILIY